jgi:hypothetical protein
VPRAITTAALLPAGRLLPARLQPRPRPRLTGWLCLACRARPASPLRQASRLCLTGRLRLASPLGLAGWLRLASGLADGTAGSSNGWQVPLGGIPVHYARFRRLALAVTATILTTQRSHREEAAGSACPRGQGDDSALVFLAIPVAVTALLAG